VKRPRFRILCPARAVTGGPEALHQLAWALTALGHSASVTYYGESWPAMAANLLLVLPRRLLGIADGPPLDKLYGRGGLKGRVLYSRVASIVPAATDTPTPYRGYGAHVIPSLPDDEPGTVVVLPELLWQLAGRWRRARTALWWLSVDNLANAYPGARSVIRRPGVWHLAQSRYAEGVLRAAGADRVVPVTDFIPWEDDGGSTSGSRQDVVLYNPKKGLHVTNALKTLLPDVTFRALERMSAADVRTALRASKVYIDFGSFPGRDRLPREALKAGCIVIAGRAGAGLFHEDLPIPEEFKLDVRDLRAVAAAIGSALREFDHQNRDFVAGAAFVARDRERFLAEVATFAHVMAEAA
jgi:hypothetical protein